MVFVFHLKHTKKKKINKNVKEKKMSGDWNILELRRWIYTHRDTNGRVMKEYLEGLETFMHQADSTPVAHENGKMFCPCRKCNNSKLATRENKWKH